MTTTSTWARPVVAPRPTERPAVPPGDEARTRLLLDALRIRWVAFPIIATFASIVAVMDSAAWRWALLGTVVPSVLASTIYEQWSLRRRAGSAAAISQGVVFVACMQLSMALGTGGLVSPAVPASIVIAFAAAAADVPRPARLVVAGLQTVAFLGFAWVQTTATLPRFIPTVFEGMASVGPALGPWLAATFLIAVAVIALIVGERLSWVLQMVYAERIQQRDRTLRLLRGHAEELTNLSSEVAHELKNPLASIKGLAALIAPQLQDPHAERMRVLRAEVERMQSVLDELLTLTRPLVPLSIEAVDAEFMLREVAELHAGIAAERAIALTVDASPATMFRGDPQKVRQILVNLLQNALDASPRGGAIRLAAHADDLDEWTFEVLDEGPGVDPNIAHRIYGRGFTTKPNGNGIGLTVALAFARQHGGDLELSRRPQGGCSAVLRLPQPPPEAS